MPLEIEIKLQVESHDSVRRVLAELNAKHLGLVRETNTFFDRADDPLRAKDSGLRVRLTVSKENAPSTALLTFKGPAAESGLHSREAFDLQVTPAEQIIPLLHALGFHEVLSFEKDRDSWLLDNCHVELDALPHFGKFLEIEGPSEEAVAALQHRLGLQNLSPVQISYSKMVAQYLSQRPKLKGELHF